MSVLGFRLGWLLLSNAHLRESEIFWYSLVVSSDDREFVWGVVVVTYSVQEHWKSINHGQLLVWMIDLYYSVFKNGQHLLIIKDEDFGWRWNRPERSIRSGLCQNLKGNESLKKKRTCTAHTHKKEGGGGNYKEPSVGARYIMPYILV